MTQGLVDTRSIREHFAEAVAEALRHHRLRAEAATSAYLVDLLCEFVGRPGADLGEPLALALNEAHTGWEHYVPRLKRVGDDALYIAGFLRESLARQQMDVSYYCTVGGVAYLRLSRVIGKQSRTAQLVRVYRELSDGFDRFTDVLADVNELQVPDNDVPALYETWLRTKSERIAQKLRLAGVTELRTPRADAFDDETSN